MHLIIAISLILLIFTQSSRADNQPIRVGVDAWVPFRFVTDSEVTGIDHDLWTELSPRIGAQVRYIRCPWKRCLEMMRSGQIDAMSGLAWRASRAEYITYTKPDYFMCSTHFYIRKNEEHRLATAQDLKQLNIGMVRGSAYYSAFDNDSTLNKTQMAQESVLLQLLSAQRIDTYIGTDCQADYELARSPWSDSFIKASFNPGNHLPLYIGLSNRSPWSKQADRISQAIQEIMNGEFPEKIRQKYYQ
ncbi:substrate-binding periplasmic protein [Oceanospirillum sediminis]|uniref:Transporter substrate-binding domain-containing protein n=1 Tax=Oceanospirillum sediminis TaxID=2760088 RepID=A0A839IU84_9GAMM|nr:transporter substrate-binding domain-containing protein [Oceanospirillum sediminis]MBB1488039.1 transporter substrate-binding domain-containing protein [Oceanospirillum sediminis]